MNPILWLILLIILLVIEAISLELTTIWFAGGALVAAVASYFGAGVTLQWGLFLGVSLILLIFTRPAASFNDIRYVALLFRLINSGKVDS